MLTPNQVNTHFNLAQVILGLTVVLLFVGLYLNSNLIIDLALGINIFVGLLFLVSINASNIKFQFELMQTIMKQSKEHALTTTNAISIK